MFHQHVQHLPVCPFDAQVLVRLVLYVGGEEPVVVLGTGEPNALVDSGVVPGRRSDRVVELDHIFGEDALLKPEAHTLPVAVEDLEQFPPLTH